jgi:predicted phage-related endonuclease
MPTATTTVTVVSFDEVALLDGYEDTIKAYNEAKKMIKHFEALKAQAEAQIRSAMGTATIGTIDGFERVVISERTRGGVDTKSLQEVFPEAYELTRTETKYTVLTTK